MFIRQRSFITIVILVLAFLSILYISKVKAIPSSQINLDVLPSEIGDWQGTNLSVSDDVLAILETKDVLIRGYNNPDGDSVTLAIVWSLHNRRTFHPPEYCYIGGGVELIDKRLEKIKIADNQVFEANKLVMQDRSRKNIAWYWFTAGERVTPSYYRQQAYFLWDELNNRKEGGALIRVSTYVKDGEDTEKAELRGQDFIKKVIPLLEEHL